MEFCSGGSCADLMKPGKIEEEYIAIIVRELLLGLDYLHSDKKLHRDVKGMSRSCHHWGRDKGTSSCIEMLTRLQLPMCSWDPMARSSSPILECLASSQRP